MTQNPLAGEKATVAELIARYNFAIDHNDFQGWADCFTPDGVFDGMNGRSAARDDVTNIVTEVDGERAHSRCFLMMTSTTRETGTKIIITGECEDRLVKHNGQWLFTSRKVHMDGA